MTRGQVRFFFAIVAVAAIVLIAIWIKGRYTDASREGEGQTASATGREARERPGAEDQPARTRPRPKDSRLARTRPAPPPRTTTRPITPAERARAVMLLEKGMELAPRGQLIAARASLADALNTEALTDHQADMARAKLAELVDKMLFSREVFKDDPCTGWYTVKRNDVLVRIERALKLHVPTQLILRINRIPDATKIQAGQKLKVVYGPFHAVVSKSRFTMDVYLEEPKTKRMIFVRRFRVGTGKDGSTPLGRWRVCLGGKIVHALWTPPSSASLPRRRVRWGEEGYPLGKEGYWISLEGIQDNAYTRADGYGIHGTHDRASIGRASSMGCIRLTNEDIALVFAMLYEQWSTVIVLP